MTANKKNKRSKSKSLKKSKNVRNVRYSGGTMAGNFREGFRSEWLAQFVFSAFGPCIPVNREDFGLDLLCNMADRKGVRLFVKYAYGVQIKSGKEPFIFEGPQVFKWLLNLEYPIILAEVLKDVSTIKIYSTWNLNHLLLSVHPDGGEVPDFIEFETNKPIGEIVVKENVATVTIGHPILEFNIMELGNSDQRNVYWDVLDFWIKFDSENILNRRAGLPVVYGLNNWTTNDLGHFSYQKYYQFNPHLYERARETFVKSCIEIGLFLAKVGEITPADLDVKRKYNDLRSLLLRDFHAELDDFGKNVFKNEIK